MRKREKVSNPASPGQVGEIIARIAPLIDYTSDEVTAIMTKSGEVRFRREARKFLSKFKANRGGQLSADLIRWDGVYEKLFGQKPNLSQIAVPEMPEGFGPMRLVVVAREVLKWTDNHPLQGTQSALKRRFPCWQYVVDLDEAIVRNDRDPKNGSCAVWVRDVREADEEFANKSADDLAGENHLGITLIERQLLEIDYFLEHGEHLDVQNVTLCTGSRNRGDNVPSAHWIADKFYVGRCYSANRGPRLRSRRVWA